MSAVQLNCHAVETEGSSAVSIGLPETAVANVKKMYEKGVSHETLSTTTDTQAPSDKVPLTDVKLCIFEECHGRRDAVPESPLDPLKTRLLYMVLALLGFWILIYVSLVYCQVI